MKNRDRNRGGGSVQIIMGSTRKRGRPKRVEVSPQACLQAYAWRLDGRPNRAILEDLRVPFPCHQWAGPDDRDQAVHRRALRYVRDGAALWASGRWETVFKNTILLGIKDPRTGEEQHSPPVEHTIFRPR
jgi:hypothetical protein